MALRLVNCSERKQPDTTSTTMITTCGVCSVNSPKPASIAEASSAFTHSTRRKPKRLSTLAAMVFMNIAPIADANVSSPDCSAVSPKPSCSISGSRKGVAPMPMRNSAPPSTPARKVWWRNRLRSISGCGCTRACHT